MHEHNQTIDAFVWYVFIPRYPINTLPYLTACGTHEQNGHHFVVGILKS